MGSCCSKEDEQEKNRQSPPGPNQTRNHQNSKKGRDFGGGTVGGTKENSLSAREAAAAAALKRQDGNGQGSKKQTDKNISERRIKDELVGKIEAYYNKINKDPPIGLAASSVEALRKHLDYIKAQAGGTA